MYIKSNLRIEIFINILRQNYQLTLRLGKEEKEDEEEREKKNNNNFYKNNDIYNTGMVTSNSKAISNVFMD